MKRSDDALQVFDDLVQLDSTFYYAFNNKGTIYFSQKNYEEALIQFEKALEIFPDYFTARINLSITLNEMAKYEEAVA